MRAAEELRSALVYRAAAAAARSQAPRWREPLRAAMADEIRHARMCADLGAELGASAPVYDAGIVRERLSTLQGPRLRLASLVLVEIAIGETLSASLFRAGRSLASEPRCRAVLTKIAGDEVRHARLGWEVIDDLWTTLSAQDRSVLADHARRGLGTIEQHVAAPALRRLDAGLPFDPALAELGVLSPEARVDAFYEALERRVLPRMRALGLDGAALWASRYHPALERVVPSTRLSR